MTIPAEKLHEMSHEELVIYANKIGASFDKQAEDAQIIEGIIEKMASQGESLGGYLYALATKGDPMLSEWLRDVRHKITLNAAKRRFFTVFLDNREGETYSQRLPGIEVRTPESQKKVLDMVVYAAGGFNVEEQAKMVEEFQADSSNFETPILVIRERSGTPWTMLYLRRRPQGDLTPETL